MRAFNRDGGPGAPAAASNGAAAGSPREERPGGPLAPGGRLSPRRVSFTEGTSGGGGGGGGTTTSGGGGGGGASAGPRLDHPSLIQTYDELGGTDSADSGTPKSQHSGALSLRTQSTQSR